MPIDIDTALGIHPMALALRARRAEILAANLAHADTPNYKSRDIDFAATLAAQKTPSKATGLQATHPAHFSAAAGGMNAADLLYRVPTQPSLDGNTVDTQVEQAEFGRNAIGYQASLTFLSGRLRGLLLAIRGE